MSRNLVLVLHLRVCKDRILAFHNYRVLMASTNAAHPKGELGAIWGLAPSTSLIIHRKGFPWHSIHLGRLLAFESLPRLRLVSRYICLSRWSHPAFCSYFLEPISCSWLTFYQFNRLILDWRRVEQLFQRKKDFCWSFLIFNLSILVTRFVVSLQDVLLSSFRLASALL